MGKELTIEQKDSIRKGIKSEGFPQFIVDASVECQLVIKDSACAERRRGEK